MRLFLLCIELKLLLLLQLAVKCMTEEEVMALYIGKAQELERDGKFKEAERYIYSNLSHYRLLEA